MEQHPTAAAVERADAQLDQAKATAGRLSPDRMTDDDGIAAVDANLAVAEQLRALRLTVADAARAARR